MSESPPVTIARSEPDLVGNEEQSACERRGWLGLGNARQIRVGRDTLVSFRPYCFSGHPYIYYYILSIAP
jgi:hypothetical protein